MKALIFSGMLISISMIRGACEPQGEGEIRAESQQKFFSQKTIS